MAKKIETDSPVSTQKFVPMLIVKVGDKDRPAEPQDIKDMENSFIKAFTDNGGPVILVTHHAVTTELVHVPVNEEGSVVIVCNDEDGTTEEA